jgi:Flp pilus assembly protein TadB
MLEVKLIPTSSARQLANMTLKDFYRKEKYIALHAQSSRFRIVKYSVLLAVAVAVYMWKGLASVGHLFLVLFIAAICLHFFFRWKTNAWTKSWGLYKRISLDEE